MPILKRRAKHRWVLCPMTCNKWVQEQIQHHHLLFMPTVYGNRPVQAMGAIDHPHTSKTSMPGAVPERLVGPRTVQKGMVKTIVNKGIQMVGNREYFSCLGLAIKLDDPVTDQNATHPLGNSSVKDRNRTQIAALDITEVSKTVKPTWGRCVATLTYQGEGCPGWLSVISVALTNMFGGKVHKKDPRMLMQIFGRSLEKDYLLYFLSITRLPQLFCLSRIIHNASLGGKST
ncbi:hypothetical protein IW262DRAFT_1296042 [Armillaria fumosa]|nr:hypothetical protein IW262DRAFT_1296042 [Armillaria fumosa]